MRLRIISVSRSVSLSSAVGIPPQSPAAKPWKGEGAGVLEVVENYLGDTWRAVYTVRFANALYVLHAFQKKSPTGTRTAQHDVDLVSERLKLARRDYEERYAKK